MCAHKCTSNRLIRKCIVFSHCESAIEIICKQNDTSSRIDKFDKIWEYAIKNLEVDMEIAWVPGHAGITYNEIADRAAKEGCTMVRDESKEGISETVAIKWIKDKTMRCWNERWKRSESGNWTKEYIREVGKKIRFPRDRSTGMAYVRPLINNAHVKDNIFKMGLSDDRECECGESRETVEHVLLECRSEEDNRIDLIEKVRKIWMDSKMTGGLQFDLRILLAVERHPQLNLIVADEVLKAVFCFFPEVK